MKNIMTLNCLKIGHKAKIIEVKNEGTIRRRLLDLGFTPGSIIEAYISSPLKDPIAYKIKNTIIAIRNNDSKNIIVEEYDEKKNCSCR